MNESNAARCWCLPTSEGSHWLVPDPADPQMLAEALSAGAPIVLARRKPDAGMGEAFRHGAGELVSGIRRAAYAVYFRAFSRSLIAGAGLVVGLALRRLPSEFKVFGLAVLALALVFAGWVLIADLLPALRWAVRCAGAERALKQAQWRTSAFCARLEEALRFRKSLSLEQRGRAPDRELLDADAYRRLIDEKVVSTAELRQLGRALEATFALSDSEPPPKVVELADRHRIDTDAVLFYLDLISAARKL